jgi:hypothetical protein
VIVFPDWHDHIDVPTVGDDVRIGTFIITVDASTVRAQSFQVSVQPGTGAGVLSAHGRAIGALLQSTHRQTAQFLDRYLRPDIKPAETDGLRVELKNLLENHRSALDYLAHHMADYCNPKPHPDRVQFPVAKWNDTAATFEPKLDQWFPDLNTSKPKLRAYLLSIQEFNDELWLQQLANLTNFNKHRSLSVQEPGEFHSVLVRFGSAGVRLGELGLRSLTLDLGGVLRFVNSAGEHADLEGPGVLDMNTTSLPGVDSRIEVLQEKRQMYRIPGQKESIAGTLWKIDKNVFRAVDRICALLA